MIEVTILPTVGSSISLVALDKDQQENDRHDELLRQGGENIAATVEGPYV
jgi:hypothetical protein